MIKSGRGMGIRHGRDGLLRAWCLVYDDGALGMLYTVEVGDILPVFLALFVFVFLFDFLRRGK